MALNLTRRITLLEQEVKGTGPAKAAADAMHDAMLTSTQRYLGADLRMENFRGGPVEFKVEAKPEAATVTLSGGTYALADKGRRRGRKRLYAKPRRRRGQRRAALDTPQGLRRYARGSRWQGFRITERHAPDALTEGVAAAMVDIRKRFAKVVG